MQTVQGLCGVCPAGCGVSIGLEAGRIARLSPVKDHPLGICCARGVRAPEIIHSPDRLTRPLRRSDSGELEPLSWDDAFSQIGEELRRIAQEYGPEAVCMYTGRGSFERSLCDLLTPRGVRTTSAWNVLFPFGSPNTTGVGSICYVAHGVLAPVPTWGVWDVDTYIDVERADVIVVWGGNPATDSSPIDLARTKSLKGDAECIVIDHRRTQTVRALKARWLGIRPGTDGALALGMIRTVIAEELYDREFVEQWTVGFEDLKAYVAGFTPEKVEAITGVSAEDVVRTARTVARAKGAALLSYTGLEYTNSGTQNMRAVLILWALTGNLDVPGGTVIRMPGELFPINQSLRLEPPNGVDPIGKSRYPLYHLYRREAHAVELPRAILENDPYPVRALVVVGSSIITAFPDPDLWRRCLDSLDFLVVVDRFPTADSAYADLVLPAASSFEVESYMVYGSTVMHRARIIDPVGESKPDWEIALGIADSLGYGDLYPRNSRQMLERALEGSGVDLDTLTTSPQGVTLSPPEQVYRKWEAGLLRADGKPGFETPTGKFEIASSILKQYGYDALPIYTEPQEGPLAAPEVARKFPLVLNTGARIQSDFRSQHHNIEGLLRMQPHPMVTLHPDDAAARGVEDGDPVTVSSPRGSVPFVARVSADIVRGVVEANAGGGSPIAEGLWKKCNVNRLTDPNNRDPISGFPVYKALLCQVTPGHQVADEEVK